MYTSPFAAKSAPGHGNQRVAGAYSHVSLHTAVSGASPHKLVALLFEGYFSALNRARGALRQGNIAAMSQSINHAVRIVDEGLKAGLNVGEGGALATDLRDLYSYITLRLTHVNLHADEAALEECVRLVQPLQDAWNAIAPASAPGR